eukprot:9251945-Alexandrium_andersonii.AAC.1
MAYSCRPLAPTPLQEGAAADDLDRQLLGARRRPRAQGHTGGRHARRCWRTPACRCCPRSGGWGGPASLAAPAVGGGSARCS